MPLPTLQEGESRNEYLKRCIPVEIEAGKEQSQAAAICNTEYERQVSNKYDKLLNDLVDKYKADR